MRRHAQGHLDTQLGGSGDRTSNLPVPVQPALPPEPHQKGTEPQRTPEHTHLIPSYLFLAVTTGTPGVPLPSNELHLKRLLIGNDWLWRKSGEHDLWRVKTPLSNQGICSKLNYISVLIIHILIEPTFEHDMDVISHGFKVDLIHAVSNLGRSTFMLSVL